MSPIPVFPKFANLSLEHKEEIQHITRKHPPYSDFNFTSLWSYNVEEDILVSQLHGNLIVRFRDYVTNEPFYSFLGDKKVVEMVKILLHHSNNEGLSQQLKLIPEVTVNKTPVVFKTFSVQEDRDNFDYIYSTEEASKLLGKKFAKKRNNIKRFRKNFPEIEVTELKISDPDKHKEVLEVFFNWEKNKRKIREQTIHELTAIKRLLQDAGNMDILGIGVYHQGGLKGFSLTEILHGRHAIFHFVKGDPLYKGIFDFIYLTTARELHSRGCLFMSREQDLGIPGLRTAKEGWGPVKFLKKYTISPRGSNY